MGGLTCRIPWLMIGVVVFVASVELVMTSVEFVTTVDLLRSVPEGPDVEGAVRWVVPVVVMFVLGALSMESYRKLSE